VSDHVFGLMHLLGFRFAPRIPNLTERKLYIFGKADTWPMLAPFIAGKVNETLVEAHWDNLLRLAASVRTGVVSASLILQRLSAYPRQNGLALALREVGRIQRTLLILDWLDDPLLRSPYDRRAEQRRSSQWADPGRQLPSPRARARPHQ
jgi:TnpA family transposase